MDRDALRKSDSLSVIGKLRDEGIFGMKMLTASLTKKNFPMPSAKPQNVRAKIVKANNPLKTVRSFKPKIVKHPQSQHKDEIRQEKQRRRQFAILTERREKLNREKKERLKREVELLKLKAKEGHLKKPKTYFKKSELTKVTPEEVKKLERLVKFIGRRNGLFNNPSNLLLERLRKVFRESSEERFILSQCISEMAPKKQLSYENGIPALTASGCIICGKSNVKVNPC